MTAKHDDGMGMFMLAITLVFLGITLGLARCAPSDGQEPIPLPTVEQQL